MAAIVASRFSVLRIEDDSDQEREKAARKKAAEEEKNKKKLTKRKKKSKPADAFDEELASMAFGKPKPPKTKKKPAAVASSPKKVSESELAEWERRDQLLVEDAFEKDLQQAMMMSKVEFERVAANIPDPDAPEPSKPAKASKKVKTNVLSVDQLQTMSNSQIDSRDYRYLQPVAPSRPAPEPLRAAGGDGADFFDQVERKTKEVVSRELAIERIRAEGPVVPPGRPEEVEQRLAAREAELEESTQELARTRDELKQAKARTKRVLGVLTQSETKEKVQLIVQLEKAQAARDAADRERAEMSAQVAALTAELEQERSRVHQLTTQLKRALGNKRRGASENEVSDVAE